MEEVSFLSSLPIYNESAIGCDVHSNNVVCCSLRKMPDGNWVETREVFDTNFRTLPIKTPGGVTWILPFFGHDKAPDILN